MRKGNAITKILLESSGHKMLLRDGLTTIVFESKNPKKGTAVFILSSEDEYIKAPPGKLELKNGKTAIVNENGKLELITDDINVENYMKVMNDARSEPSKSETLLKSFKLRMN